VIAEPERGPCEDERCPGVLAGPADPDLCPACRAAFERSGVETSDEQLTLLEISVEEFRSYVAACLRGER
jgi:hypothetical protein